MRPLAAALGFLFATTIAALILGCVLPGLSATAAWAALAVGVCTAGAAWRSTRVEAAPPLRFWDWAMLGLFALASLRAFLWIIYERGDEICVLSPNNLGDMSLHLNFIRNLASGVPFWPENPILSGVPLTYPLGADLFNSVLEAAGADTFRGLVGVGLLGAALTGYALWRWGGAFGVAAFLFNGGLAGFIALRTLQIEDFQQELVWKNFFLAMFVTQRGLLFALPAGLLLLSAWRERYLREGKPIMADWLELFLYASLPLFNFHAFFFLSLILLAIFLARKSARRSLLLFVGLAFVPATLCTLLITGGFSTSSGVRLAPEWVMEDKGWGTWIWSFGLTLPLWIVLALMLIRKEDLEARCLVWTSSLVFIFCCVIAFAPWTWDNMKLMMWAWLVIAPYLWTVVLAPLPLLARAALCFALFFSGAVSLAGGLDKRHGYRIASRAEIAAWGHAIADIPADDRFACVPDYNHPLLLLGRRVACGYEGHLWSHGLRFRETFDLLKSSLNGRTPWQRSAPILDARWLALRKEDTKAASPPLTPVQAGWYGRLYDLRAKPPEASPAPRQSPPQSAD